jgi:uncharacterized SAM-binding protein YcdF (DUF218 family)
MRSPWVALRAVLLRLLLTALLLVPAGLALIDAYGRQDLAQPADAIVILGSRVYPGGRPGPSLRRRTQHAVALYQRGLAPAIICTGGVGDGDSPPSEGEAACSLAASLGVPRTALLVEGRARSTEENAQYTALILRAHNWHTAVIVSDGYHLYRARLLFAAAGVTAYPSPSQGTAGPMNPVERYARGLRELAALAWYWGKDLAGYRATDFP